MKLVKRVGFIIISTLVLFVLVAFFAPPMQEMTITNAPTASNLPFAFPQNTPIGSNPQTGVQIKKSLLGIQVKFLNGNVDYAGPAIVQDPRYQALTNSEKLVDSIAFQPPHGSAFLILIAIAKSPSGIPMIIPGKFEIIHKTEQNGFFLKDTHGRKFYYSGYILITPIWNNLTPGQILQDKFCKVSVPMTMCPPKDVVNVILKKPLDYRKDIPFLTIVK